MNKKLKALASCLALLASFFVASPAQAAQTSSVTLQTPSYVQKSIASNFEISVCSGSNCSFATRSIALYVNGVKTKSWKTSSKSFTYSWKSSKTGSFKVQVKVAATGSYKAVNSVTKKVTVKTGMLNTATSGWYSYTKCPSDRCTLFPIFIVPTDDSSSNITIWLGTDYRQDGREVILQWKKANGTWVRDDSGYVDWDEETEEYFVNLQFNFAREEYCEDSDGSEWSYRIFMPATSRATQADGYNRTLHLRCNVPYPASGNAVADFDYEDQVTSSAPSFWFYTQADSGVGMTLYVETCDLDEGLDCDDSANWYHYESSELNVESYDVGSWESRTVNDVSSHFLVRGVVVPDDGSTILYSDTYDVTSY